LINWIAVLKVEKHVADAASTAPDVTVANVIARGNFVEPTVLSNVPPMPLVSQEEPSVRCARCSVQGEADVYAMSQQFAVGLASYFIA